MSSIIILRSRRPPDCFSLIMLRLGARAATRRQLPVAPLYRTLCAGIDERRFLKPLKTKRHGVDILHDPLWNKGTAFSVPERDRLNLRGLLPPRVRSLEYQIPRAMKMLRSFGEGAEADMRKNLWLQDLHNRNETLYHRCEHCHH